MVIEAAVLLRIQNFKQCRGSISLVIAACLVDLVKEHQRIADARLLQGNSDASRHCPYISLTMSTDLSFVTNAAKTDTDIFLVKCLCHRMGNGGLTSSRRSHKTEDRTLAAGSQFTHGKKFHDTLLDFFEAVMSLLQDLPCFGKIHGILGFLIPRKIQQCFDIGAKHAALSCTAVHALETVDLLADLILDFF